MSPEIEEAMKELLSELPKNLQRDIVQQIKEEIKSKQTSVEKSGRFSNNVFRLLNQPRVIDIDDGKAVKALVGKKWPKLESIMIKAAAKQMAHWMKDLPPGEVERLDGKLRVDGGYIYPLPRILVIEGWIPAPGGHASYVEASIKLSVGKLTLREAGIQG